MKMMIKQHIKAAPKMLYPDIPPTPLPPSLSLEKYEGTYEHPAYGTIPISLKDGELHGVLGWRISIEFRLEHASGDFFVFIPVSSAIPIVAKTQFELGYKGTVEKFGAHLEGDKGDEPMIWFTRKQEPALTT
jgi:hypothetical protein